MTAKPTTRHLLTLALATVLLMLAGCEEEDEARCAHGGKLANRGRLANPGVATVIRAHHERWIARPQECT